MKSIFETCVPREEVLRGELREQQFAASLTKVLRGNADEVYKDAATFFANTYATNASCRMAVRAEFEGGITVEGDQFQTIRDVLDSLGMGKIVVDGQVQAGEAVHE